MRVLANVNYFKDCLARDFTIYECAKDNHFDIHEKQGCGSVDFRLVISMYYLHLKKWMQFYPRESFLLLRMEDMSSDPYMFMRSITNFLHIDSLPYQSIKALATLKRKYLWKCCQRLGQFFQSFFVHSMRC